MLYLNLIHLNRTIWKPLNLQMIRKEKAGHGHCEKVNMQKEKMTSSYNENKHNTNGRSPQFHLHLTHLKGKTDFPFSHFFLFCIFPLFFYYLFILVSVRHRMQNVNIYLNSKWCSVRRHDVCILFNYAMITGSKTTKKKWHQQKGRLFWKFKYIQIYGYDIRKCYIKVKLPRKKN